MLTSQIRAEWQRRASALVNADGSLDLPLLTGLFNYASVNAPVADSANLFRLSDAFPLAQGTLVPSRLAPEGLPTAEVQVRNPNYRRGSAPAPAPAPALAALPESVRASILTLAEQATWAGDCLLQVGDEEDKKAEAVAVMDGAAKLLALGQQGDPDPGAVLAALDEVSRTLAQARKDNETANFVLGVAGDETAALLAVVTNEVTASRDRNPGRTAAPVVAQEWLEQTWVDAQAALSVEERDALLQSRREAIGRSGAEEDAEITTALESRFSDDAELSAAVLVARTLVQQSITGSEGELNDALAELGAMVENGISADRFSEVLGAGLDTAMGRIRPVLRSANLAPGQEDYSGRSVMAVVADKLEAMLVSDRLAEVPALAAEVDEADDLERHLVSMLESTTSSTGRRVNADEPAAEPAVEEAAPVVGVPVPEPAVAAEAAAPVPAPAEPRFKVGDEVEYRTEEGSWGRGKVKTVVPITRTINGAPDPILDEILGFHADATQYHLENGEVFGGDAIRVAHVSQISPLSVPTPAYQEVPVAPAVAEDAPVDLKTVKKADWLEYKDANGNTRYGMVEQIRTLAFLEPGASDPFPESGQYTFHLLGGEVVAGENASRIVESVPLGAAEAASFFFAGNNWYQPDRLAVLRRALSTSDAGGFAPGLTEAGDREEAAKYLVAEFSKMGLGEQVNRRKSQQKGENLMVDWVAARLTEFCLALPSQKTVAAAPQKAPAFDASTVQKGDWIEYNDHAGKKRVGAVESIGTVTAFIPGQQNVGRAPKRYDFSLVGGGSANSENVIGRVATVDLTPCQVAAMYLGGYGWEQAGRQEFFAKLLHSSTAGEFEKGIGFDPSDESACKDAAGVLVGGFRRVKLDEQVKLRQSQQEGEGALQGWVSTKLFAFCEMEREAARGSAVTPAPGAAVVEDEPEKMVVLTPGEWVGYTDKNGVRKVGLVESIVSTGEFVPGANAIPVPKMEYGLVGGGYAKTGQQLERLETVPLSMSQVAAIHLSGDTPDDHLSLGRLLGVATASEEEVGLGYNPKDAPQNFSVARSLVTAYRVLNDKERGDMRKSQRAGGVDLQNYLAEMLRSRAEMDREDAELAATATGELKSLVDAAQAGKAANDALAAEEARRAGLLAGMPEDAPDEKEGKMPAFEESAREYAMSVVNSLISVGRYTSADAEKEVGKGYRANGVAGYDIKRGKITIPNWHGRSNGGQPWTFSFRELSEAGATARIKDAAAKFEEKRDARERQEAQAAGGESWDEPVTGGKSESAVERIRVSLADEPADLEPVTEAPAALAVPVVPVVEEGVDPAEMHQGNFRVWFLNEKARKRIEETNRPWNAMLAEKVNVEDYELVAKISGAHAVEAFGILQNGLNDWADATQPGPSVSLNMNAADGRLRRRSIEFADMLEELDGDGRTRQCLIVGGSAMQVVEAPDKLKPQAAPRWQAVRQAKGTDPLELVELLGAGVEAQPVAVSAGRKGGSRR